MSYFALNIYADDQHGSPVGTINNLFSADIDQQVLQAYTATLEAYLNDPVSPQVKTGSYVELWEGSGGSQSLAINGYLKQVESTSDGTNLTAFTLASGMDFLNEFICLDALYMQFAKGYLNVIDSLNGIQPVGSVAGAGQKGLLSGSGWWVWWVDPAAPTHSTTLAGGASYGATSIGLGSVSGFTQGHMLKIVGPGGDDFYQITSVNSGGSSVTIHPALRCNYTSGVTVGDMGYSAPGNGDSWFASLSTAMVNLTQQCNQYFTYAREESGRVVSIEVTNGGSGYTSPPTVNITSLTGAGAYAVAFLSGGTVNRIIVTHPGKGYGAGDVTVTLSGGGGSGAAATGYSVSRHHAGLIALGPLNDPSGLTLWGGQPLRDDMATSHSYSVPVSIPDTTQAQRLGYAVVDRVHMLSQRDQICNVLWCAGSGSGSTEVTLRSYFGDVLNADGTTASGVTSSQYYVNSLTSGRIYYFGKSVASWNGNTYQLVASARNDGTWEFGVANTTSIATYGVKEKWQKFLHQKDAYGLLTNAIAAVDYSGDVPDSWEFPTWHPRTSLSQVPTPVLPGMTINIHYAGHVIQSAGQITSPSVKAGGSGYSSAPVVAFYGGGGTGAAATATVSGGQVTGISITSGGSNYLTPPMVALIGGGGQNAIVEVAVTTADVVTRTFPNTTDPVKIAKLSRCVGIRKVYTAEQGLQITYTMGSGKVDHRVWRARVAKQIADGHSQPRPTWWTRHPVEGIHFWLSKSPDAWEDDAHGIVNLSAGAVVVSDVGNAVQFIGDHHEIRFSVFLNPNQACDVWVGKPLFGGLGTVNLTGVLDQLGNQVYYTMFRIAAAGYGTPGTNGTSTAWYTTVNGTDAGLTPRGKQPPNDIVNNQGQVPGAQNYEVVIQISGGHYNATVSTAMHDDGDAIHTRQNVATWIDTLAAAGPNGTNGAFGWHCAGGSSPMQITNFHARPYHVKGPTRSKDYSAPARHRWHNLVFKTTSVNTNVVPWVATIQPTNKAKGSVKAYLTSDDGHQLTNDDGTAISWNAGAIPSAVSVAVGNELVYNAASYSVSDGTNTVAAKSFGQLSRVKAAKSTHDPVYIVGKCSEVLDENTGLVWIAGWHANAYEVHGVHIADGAVNLKQLSQTSAHRGAISSGYAWVDPGGGRMWFGAANSGEKLQFFTDDGSGDAENATGGAEGAFVLNAAGAIGSASGILGTLCHPIGNDATHAARWPSVGGWGSAMVAFCTEFPAVPNVPVSSTTGGSLGQGVGQNTIYCPRFCYYKNLTLQTRTGTFNQTIETPLSSPYNCAAISNVTTGKITWTIPLPPNGWDGVRIYMSQLDWTLGNVAFNQLTLGTHYSVAGNVYTITGWPASSVTASFGFSAWPSGTLLAKDLNAAQYGLMKWAHVQDHQDTVTGYYLLQGYGNGGLLLSTGNLPPDVVQPPHQRALNSPSDQAALTYDAASGQHKWQPASGLVGASHIHGGYDHAVGSGNSGMAITCNHGSFGGNAPDEIMVTVWSAPVSFDANATNWPAQTYAPIASTYGTTATIINIGGQGITFDVTKQYYVKWVAIWN